MIKTCVMTAAVAAWAFGGGAFARPAIQDTPKDTTAVSKKAADKSEKAVDKSEKAAKKTGGDVTDATLTAEVKARLTKDKVGRVASIDVDSKSGVVTITGSVPSGNDVVRLGRLVETTKGVKSVVNDLTIGKQ